MIEYTGGYQCGECKRGFYHPGIRLKNLTTRGKFYRFLGNKLLMDLKGSTIKTFSFLLFGL